MYTFIDCSANWQPKRDTSIDAQWELLPIVHLAPTGAQLTTPNPMHPCTKTLPYKSKKHIPKVKKRMLSWERWVGKRINQNMTVMISR